MVKFLPASSFVEASMVPVQEAQYTPFQSRDSDVKLEWANRQIDRLYFLEDVIQIQLNQHGAPSTATYISWLKKALKARLSDDNKYLQTRVKGNTLYVRKAERKEGKASGKVRHVIT